VSSDEERQPNKQEAEMAFEILRPFKVIDEQNDRVFTRGSETLIALTIAKTLARYGDQAHLIEANYWRDWLRTQPIGELAAAIEERIKLLEDTLEK